MKLGPLGECNKVGQHDDELLRTIYRSRPFGESVPDKAGKNGISQNLARRIVEKFPELSVGWLLTGEGDMFSKVRPTAESRSSIATWWAEDCCVWTR